MAWYGFYLLGVITGLVGGVLIDRDTVNKYANKIRKVKIKNSHDISDVIDIKTEIKEAKQKKRQIRPYHHLKSEGNVILILNLKL